MVTTSLRKAEDNGFVHQITNIDGQHKIFAICNCNVNVCYALRTSQLFNTPNMSRSAYVAHVDKDNCVACGRCVEVCPAGAATLGQKLCKKDGSEVVYPKMPLPTQKKWSQDMWTEDYRDINKQRNLLALKRIVTQEIPHDGLNLLFEPDEALEIHDGVVEMLSESPDTDVITSYGKVGLLDLSGEQGDRTDVEQAQQLVYDAAGVTKELFSASSPAGLEMSLDNDLSMMMILGRKFAHFFSVLMNNKFGNKKISFNFVILPVSYYNLDEYTSKAKDLAAFGYVFLTPVAASGVNQVNLSDLKSLENDVLDLDEVLKPLQSAYTQSGKTNAVTAQATKDANKSATASSSSSSSSESKSTTSTSETSKSN